MGRMGMNGNECGRDGVGEGDNGNDLNGTRFKAASGAQRSVVWRGLTGLSEPGYNGGGIHHPGATPRDPIEDP